MMLPVCLFVFSLQSQVQELKVVASDVAGGTYSYNTGFYGEDLELKGDGTLKREFWQDVGPSKTRSRGTWRIDGDTVVITYAAGGGTRKLVPVRWNSYFYLIREPEIRNFAKWTKEHGSPGLEHMRRGAVYLVKVANKGAEPKPGLFVPKSHLSYFR